MDSRLQKELSDADLVKKTLKGETHAFDQLVERYHGISYAIAWLRLKNRESAEDLAQEVFIRAFLHLKRLRDPNTFSVWIQQMTRNLAKDWQRRNIRKSKIVNLLPMEDIMQETLADSRSQNARESIQQKEQSYLVNQVLNKMPAEQRDVLKQHIVEELSLREIARNLDLHHSTIAERLQKAMKTFRQLIEEDKGNTENPLVPESSAKTRTLASIAALSAISTAKKAELIAETSSGVTWISGMMSSQGIIGFFTSILQLLQTFFTTGATTMGIGKIIASIGIVGAAATGYFIFTPDDTNNNYRRTAQAGYSGNTVDKKFLKKISKLDVVQEENVTIGDEVHCFVPHGKTVYLKSEGFPMVNGEGWVTADKEGNIHLQTTMENGQTIEMLVGPDQDFKAEATSLLPNFALSLEFNPYKKIFFIQSIYTVPGEGGVDFYWWADSRPDLIEWQIELEKQIKQGQISPEDAFYKMWTHFESQGMKLENEDHRAMLRQAIKIKSEMNYK